MAAAGAADKQFEVNVRWNIMSGAAIRRDPIRGDAQTFLPMCCQPDFEALGWQPTSE
jgi:hypothetical protein